MSKATVGAPINHPLPDAFAHYDPQSVLRFKGNNPRGCGLIPTAEMSFLSRYPETGRVGNFEIWDVVIRYVSHSMR